eukprot:TRINITY_DN6193_c0_g1_i1.p1 TRINITY_DN6193_c0_g1~~TRINITY_DN6193_c0_g1_i1.p1  ORF type:complete len:516 (-),score=59.61 TRINITY_DN6193_c0_g1_i1:91-1638(-)
MEPSVVASYHQIVSEAFHKAAQVILHSRVSFSTDLSSQHAAPDQVPKTKEELDKEKVIRNWFNLEIYNQPVVSDQLLMWKRTAVGSIPLFIDVIFEPSARSSSSPNEPAPASYLLERWRVAFQPPPNIRQLHPEMTHFAEGTLPSAQPHGKQPRVSKDEPSTIYKKTVILMRSLFTFLRLMPSYRLVRECRRNKTARARIRYTVKSAGDPRVAFGGRDQPSQFEFAPISTPLGSLGIAVVYRQECDFKIAVDSPSLYIIQEYSPPTAAKHNRNSETHHRYGDRRDSEQDSQRMRTISMPVIPLVGSGVPQRNDHQRAHPGSYQSHWPPPSDPRHVPPPSSSTDPRHGGGQYYDPRDGHGLTTQQPIPGMGLHYPHDRHTPPCEAASFHNHATSPPRYETDFRPSSAPTKYQTASYMTRANPDGSSPSRETNEGFPRALSDANIQAMGAATAPRHPAANMDMFRTQTDNCAPGHEVSAPIGIPGRNRHPDPCHSTRHASHSPNSVQIGRASCRERV